MSAIPWIMITIAILIAILALLTVWVVRNRGKKHEHDYYSFFTMGVIWTAFGLIFWKDMPFFFIMGLAFMTLGLANKDKWESNRRRWGDMDKKERKIMTWVMIILGALVLLGVIVFFLA